MALVVQKFGGSSVANPERILRVANRIAETYRAGNSVCVVVSAMGDTTDDLIDLAAQLSEKPSKREMDMLMATGEQQSIALLAITLHTLGLEAVSFTGPQAGFMTDGTYGMARILEIKPDRVKEALSEGKICIIAGFQGLAENGDICTLGRGGSDTSAAALAIALNADVCEIFTDVNGVYTADPRVVPEAHKLNTVSYDEMLEMAAMGAGVLHPRSVELSKQYNLKMHVRSSFNHEEGTIVQEEMDMSQQLEKDMVVCGIAHDLNVIKVTVFDVPDKPGIAASLFSALAVEKVNVDMIVQSGTINNHQDISFTCGKQDKDKVITTMSKMIPELGAESYVIEDGVAKISIVGAGMITHSGVAAKMFSVLCEIGCNLNIISTSEIKISCIIEAEKTNEAVKALHNAFIG